MMIHREGWSAGDEPLAIELNCFGCNKPFDTYDEAETFCPDCLANQRSIDDAVALWSSRTPDSIKAWRYAHLSPIPESSSY